MDEAVGGSIEGDRIVLPVTGPALFEVRTTGYRQRPAYTKESLAVALRDGIDSAGQALDPLMPHYRLSAAESSALMDYLNSLGREDAPGVSDSEIFFATVMTDDVEPERRASVVAVLSKFFDEKNSLSRNEERRSRRSPFFRDYKYKAYRKWVLVPWLLQGDPETWQSQLREYYEEQPVFAVLSGISGRPWDEIHDFCERHEIPTILPNTDRPPISADSYYTLYYSQGVTLEARVIAAHLDQVVGEAPSRGKILQVFRGSRGRDAAGALESTANRLFGLDVISWQLQPSVTLDRDALAKRAETVGARAVVLWLEAEDLDVVRDEAGEHGIPSVYLSATLLGDPSELLAESVAGERVWLVQPYTLEQERRERSIRVKGWLRSRAIEVNDNERVLAQTYYACLLAGAGLAHIKRYFSRDYFLDSLDHKDNMAVYSATYPRLSFGPGQRYLSKGAYVIDLRVAAPDATRATFMVPPET